MTTNIGVIAEDEHGRPYGVLMADSQRSATEAGEVTSKSFDAEKIKLLPEVKYAYALAGLALNNHLGWSNKVQEAYRFLTQPEKDAVSLFNQLENGYLSASIHLNNLLKPKHGVITNFMLLTNRNGPTIYTINNGPVKEYHIATSGSGGEAARLVLDKYLSSLVQNIISMDKLIDIAYEAMENAKEETNGTGGHLDVAIATINDVYLFTKVYDLHKGQKKKLVPETVNRIETMTYLPRFKEMDIDLIENIYNIDDPTTIASILPQLPELYHQYAMSILIGKGDVNHLVAALPKITEDCHYPILSYLHDINVDKTYLQPLLKQELPANTLLFLEDMCQ